MIGSLLFIHPKTLIELRIVLYILIFILFRDTMTPLGFWEINSGMIIRFPNSPLLLFSLGVISAGFVICVYQFEPQLYSLVIWIRGSKTKATVLGALGAFIVAGPALLFYHTPFVRTVRPPVPTDVLFPLFTLLILGNFLEEVLFRGYLQGHIERITSPMRAAIISGFSFPLFIHSWPFQLQT